MRMASGRGHVSVCPIFERFLPPLGLQPEAQNASKLLLEEGLICEGLHALHR